MQDNADISPESPWPASPDLMYGKTSFADSSPEFDNFVELFGLLERKVLMKKS